jgi:hypothetical protein
MPTTLYFSSEVLMHDYMHSFSTNTNIDTDYTINFWHGFKNEVHLAWIADMIRANTNIKSLKLNLCPPIGWQRHRPTYAQEQIIADALLVNHTIEKFDTDFFNYPIILEALRQRVVYQNALYNCIGQTVVDRQAERAVLEQQDEQDEQDDHQQVPRVDQPDQVYLSPLMLLVVQTTMPTVDCTEHIEYLAQKYERQRLKALVRDEYHMLIRNETLLRGSLMVRTHGNNGHIVEWLEPFFPDQGFYKSNLDLTQEQIVESEQRCARIRALFSEYVDALRP